MYHLKILGLSLAPSFSMVTNQKLTNCYKIKDKLRNYDIFAFNVNELPES